MFMKSLKCFTVFLFIAVFLLFVFSLSPLYSENRDTGSNDRPKCCARSDVRPAGVFNGPAAGGYFLIRFYQVFISPQNGPRCGYTPGCSTYGREAVGKHGLFVGSFMAGERLLRCNPYRKPGDDPVPDNLSDVDTRGRPGR